MDLSGLNRQSTDKEKRDLDLFVKDPKKLEKSCLGRVMVPNCFGELLSEALVTSVCRAT